MDDESVNLKLCLYGGKEATVEKSFVKSTTLEQVQQEMRNVFDVSNKCESKLWINSSVYTFSAPASDSLEQDESRVKFQPQNESLKDINTSLSNNNNSSSPIKPPPTPPPMPSSSLSNSSANNNDDSTSLPSQASPTVVTRQAAHSMNRQPIALPDSGSLIPTSALDSGKKESTSSPTQTLREANVTDNSVVTLEVINSDGTWPSSRPRYQTVTTRSSKAQPGLCGLSNMGNTCFMNAALQCLSNTPTLTNYILSDTYVGDINIENPLGMHGEIARTYAELIKVMWSGGYTSYLPREFKCAVSRFAPQFTGFAQQDCQELMAFLLDGLHEDLNRIRNKPYIEVKNDTERRPDEEVAAESWANYKKRNDSIVVDTFHAMLKSTLVCPECDLVSVTFDPFCYLSLPLPVKREKQVNLIFLPAPSQLDGSKIKTALSVLDPEDAKVALQYGNKISSFDEIIEEHAGYLDKTNRPKGCKMQVPRSGPASELCDIVARIINEERLPECKKVIKDNLVVAELAMGRISKIYESSEHYSQISDDIVVVEKSSNYVLPAYLKERRPSGAIDGMSKLMFLHVADLKYETLYKSIIASLSNLTSQSVDDIHSWCRLSPPASTPPQTGDRMDITNDDSGSTTEDGDEVMQCANGLIKANGKDIEMIKSSKKPAFELGTVNSFGNHSFETLGPDKKVCDYSSKLYLGVTFSTEIASSAQFEHNCVLRGETFDTFTPKVSPKPTLQLKDCINQFTNAERLGADDPWYCPRCKKHQQAIKKFDVWSLPKVLIIHLKRFSFSRSWRDKIDTLVEFPVEKLDMSAYVHNPEQKKSSALIYNLIGVANHFGGLGGGHYTAYAKNAGLDAWYSFDDALVTQTSASNVVTRSAYVLFYQLHEEEEVQGQ